MRTFFDRDHFPSARRPFQRIDRVSDFDHPAAVEVSDRTMKDALESTDSGWHVDPVAGTIAGQLPVTLAVDGRSLKRRAIVCMVLAAASVCGYATAPALWPVAALAGLLALAGGRLLRVVAAQDGAACRRDGFQADRRLTRTTRHAMA
nr:hypothetical protein [Burkholderia cepacia]